MLIVLIKCVFCNNIKIKANTINHIKHKTQYTHMNLVDNNYDGLKLFCVTTCWKD